MKIFRCVRAPIEFEDIPLSSHVASDELFERAVMAVRRNGIAIKGSFLFCSILYSYQFLGFHSSRKYCISKHDQFIECSSQVKRTSLIFQHHSTKRSIHFKELVLICMPMLFDVNQILSFQRDIQTSTFSSFEKTPKENIHH